MNTTTQINWIDSKWLHSNHSPDITIIDTQPDIGLYISHHIPQAIYLNENHFRLFRYNLPTHYAPLESIQNLLQFAGIQQSKPVVVYGGKGTSLFIGDGLEQTMVAYSLARFGVSQIYILDGGFDSWTDSKYNTSKHYPSVQKSSFVAHINNDLFITYKEFSEIYRNKNINVIDVRPPHHYQNESLWVKPGHIPGAVNFPWRLLMDHKNPRKLGPDHKANELIQSKNITPDKKLIIYCGTGREATAAFIYFKFYLNYPDVKIYEGSFTEWCTYPDAPTVTGPKPY